MSLIFKELYVERILSGYDWILKFKSDMVKDRICGIGFYIMSINLHWCNIKKFSTGKTIGLFQVFFQLMPKIICKYIHICHYLFWKTPSTRSAAIYKEMFCYKIFDVWILYDLHMQHSNIHCNLLLFVKFEGYIILSS